MRVAVVGHVEWVQFGHVQHVPRAGELVLINPGERHTYWAEQETAAYLVFAGLPGVRARPWSLKRREEPEAPGAPR